MVLVLLMQSTEASLHDRDLVWCYPWLLLDQLLNPEALPVAFDHRGLD